jgi:hypothetical protein
MPLRIVCMHRVHSTGHGPRGVLSGNVIAVWQVLLFWEQLVYETKSTAYANRGDVFSTLAGKGPMCAIAWRETVSCA